jgi:hypothetical protein
MPSLNMPVQRLKVAILPLDLTCSGPVTHSGEILTTGKSRWFVCCFNTRGNVLALELNCGEEVNISSSFLLRDRKISTSFLLSEEAKAHPGL